MEWSLIFFLHIKALSNGMVIDFFVTLRPSPFEWSFFFVTLRPSPMEWLSLVFYFPYHDPLHGIGRQIRVNRFLLIFFLLKIRTKLVSLSLLIFYCDNLKMLYFHII